MKFLLNPQRSDSTLTISVESSVLTVNNIEYNLEPMIPGSRIRISNDIAFNVYKSMSEAVEVYLPLPYTLSSGIDTFITHEVITDSGTVNIPGQPIVEYEEPVSVYNIDWSKAELPAAQLSIFEKDQQKYKKRADVQSDLLAWMAADSMSRVRNGTWSVEQLTGLLNDPAIRLAQTYMSTLSFELAAQAINSAVVAELTPEIKLSWINKLEEHYYSTT